MQQFGLEWLWRIKEEPHLWRRYWNDGFVLLRLLFARVLPLAIAIRLHRLRAKQAADLLINRSQHDQSTLISLCGVATESHIQNAISYFQEALTAHQNVIIDLSDTCFIDARFFGLLLMLRKQLKRQGAKLMFSGVSPAIRRIFRLNELGFLLSPDLII